MAQAGIHAMVGMAVGRWTPDREWLLLGIVIGNLTPDADNLAVAVATVAGVPTAGLHRTFTHSLFTVAGIMLGFAIAGRIRRRRRWTNLGVGLGIGVLMHVLLDLLVWFNGVEILWPLDSWVNLWEGVTPPEWWTKLMMPVEFLFLALYFVALAGWSREQGTDRRYTRALHIWTAVQAALFVVFLLLVYTMPTGFMVPYGALYLVSLGLALGVTIRMRDTIGWYGRPRAA
jgi:membrane-bound metal-dependent hydrolase YbcI (DUF457 family)